MDRRLKGLALFALLLVVPTLGHAEEDKCPYGYGNTFEYQPAAQSYQGRGAEAVQEGRGAEAVQEGRGAEAVQEGRGAEAEQGRGMQQASHEIQTGRGSPMEYGDASGRGSPVQMWSYSDGKDWTCNKCNHVNACWQERCHGCSRHRTIVQPQDDI